MTINLRFDQIDYSEAMPLEEKDLLHRNEMEKALGIFNELYTKAKAKDNSYKDDGVTEAHNNISIFASRGEGKTSFLLTMLKRIRKKYSGCVCQPPIDPSHIESKQHPFVNIIAAIQERVDEKINNSDVASGKSQSYDDYLYFKKCYSDVLNGLHIIDGIGNERPYDGWDDNDYISLQGMDKAKASNNLERNFHEYINRALLLLGKECFVISFDDIDTDFKKGFDILEVIRKFLTTNKIITILTGDQTLYTNLVRKAQWAFFDDKYLRKEIDYAGKQKAEFSQMIDQLENQYMVKILKPENRVTLQSMQEFLNKPGNDITINFGTGKEERLTEVYQSILNDLGAKSSSQLKLVNFMTSLTLRIQIRMLTLRSSQLKLGKTEEDMRDSMIDGLMNVFSTDIYQTSDNAKALVNGVPLYTVEMLNLLRKNKCLNVATGFMPETGNSILDRVLMVVGLKFDQYLCASENRFLIFDYWLRLCYLRFMAQRIGGGEGQATERPSFGKENMEQLDTLLAFNRLHTDAGLIKSVGLAQAYYNGTFMNGIYRSGDVATLAGTIFIGHGVPASLSEKTMCCPLWHY